MSDPIPVGATPQSPLWSPPTDQQKLDTQRFGMTLLLRYSPLHCTGNASHTDLRGCPSRGDEIPSAGSFNHQKQPRVQMRYWALEQCFCPLWDHGPWAFWSVRPSSMTAQFASALISLSLVVPTSNGRAHGQHPHLAASFLGRLELGGCYKCGIRPPPHGYRAPCGPAPLLRRPVRTWNGTPPLGYAVACHYTSSAGS